MTKMNESDHEALDEAIRNGDLEAVRAIVDKFEEVRDDSEYMGENLRSAIAANDKSLVEYFLNQGVDLEYRDPEVMYFGGLNSACGKGFLELAQFLHSRGAKVCTATIRENPLFDAIHGRHVHVVKWLLSTEMDIHAEYLTDGGGYTSALLLASNWGQDDEIVQLLRTAGCRLSTDDQSEKENPVYPEVESSKTLEDLVATVTGDVAERLKQDVCEHVESLKRSNVTFYGYAIQTPTFYDFNQPIAAYNGESDLTDENRDSTYHRYSVDEWQHYENDSLPRTSAAMKVISQDYQRLLSESDADSEKFINTVYKAFACVLKELQDEQVFSPQTFLMVWIDDEELLTEFARQLNPTSVAKAFAREFGL